MKSAKVFVRDQFAGILEENDTGYAFEYDANYLENQKASPVSLTMPLRKEPYSSKVLFPFFDGLIPEGWLLEMAVRNWKLNPNDRFAILLKTGKDPIGYVSVEEV